MKNNYILHAILVSGVVLLLAGLALLWVPDSLDLITRERKTADPYDELKSYIKKARSIALELKEFKWSEFATIGLEAPPSEVCKLGERVTEKGGLDMNSGSKWIALPELLPRPESADPLVFYCNTCLKMVERIRLQKPEQPEHFSTISQWVELCNQLQSTLSGARYLTQSYKNTNELVLTNIEKSIGNSDLAIRQKYLQGFKNKSARYLSQLGELISNLELAEQILPKLTGEGFAGEVPLKEGAE